MQEQKLIRLGVIGAGKIVEQIHLPVLKTIPGIQINWLTDQDPARRNLLSNMFRVKAIELDDLESHLNSVDVLLLAIPLGARGPFIELAARNNKALYVEKPFARSLQEHLSYESLFPQEKLCVGFNRRTYSSVSLLKEIIAADLFGKMRAVKLTDTNFDLKSGGSKAYLTQAEQAGGGLTIESGIHLLDQIVHVTQPANVEVGWARGIHSHGLDYEMACRAMLTHESGSQFEAEILLSRLRNDPSEFVFVFERACVHVPLKPASKLVITSNAGYNSKRFQLEAANQQEFMVDTIEAAFYELWRMFLEAIATKRINYSSACSSRQTSNWIGQIYQKLYAQA